MKVYGNAKAYKKLLLDWYKEIQELRDWGFPLPELENDYYDFLLEVIMIAKSKITECTV